MKKAAKKKEFEDPFWVGPVCTPEIADLSDQFEAVSVQDTVSPELTSPFEAVSSEDNVYEQPASPWTLLFRETLDKNQVLREHLDNAMKRLFKPSVALSSPLKPPPPQSPRFVGPVLNTHPFEHQWRVHSSPRSSSTSLGAHKPRKSSVLKRRGILAALQYRMKRPERARRSQELRRRALRRC